MMNTNMIGTIDNASKEVLEQEAKAEDERKEENKEKEKKNKTRGVSKKQKRIVGKQSVYDEKTTAKLQEFLRNRKRIKNSERERQNTELGLLNQLSVSNFDPLKVIKKKIRKDKE